MNEKGQQEYGEYYTEIFIISFLGFLPPYDDEKLFIFIIFKFYKNYYYYYLDINVDVILNIHIFYYYTLSMYQKRVNLLPSHWSKLS